MYLYNCCRRESFVLTNSCHAPNEVAATVWSGKRVQHAVHPTDYEWCWRLLRRQRTPVDFACMLPPDLICYGTLTKQQSAARSAHQTQNRTCSHQIYYGACLSNRLQHAHRTRNRTCRWLTRRRCAACGACGRRRRAGRGPTRRRSGHSRAHSRRRGWRRP